MLGHHEYLLNLLKGFDKLCTDNGVEYTLFAGTLLGAIRHGGFIPWDDDLDVMMDYQNYEKLKSVYLTGGFPSNRVLVAPEIQGEREMQLTRFVDTDTTRYFMSGSLGNGYNGEGIDIFIFDPVADDEESIQGYMENLVLTHELCSYSCTSMNRYRMPVELYDQYLERVEKEGRLAVIQELERERVKFFDPNGTNFIYRWHTKRHLVPRRYFQGTKRVPFEDTMLPVPTCASMLLMNEFEQSWPEFPGDIKIDQHGTPHSYDFSYKEMAKEFHPSVPHEEILQEMLERKRFMIQTTDLIMGQRDAYAHGKALRTKAELERQLELYGQEFEQALAAKDADKLYGLLADYISVQSSKDMIGYLMYADTFRYVHPEIIQVPDVVFEAAVFALMGQDKIATAAYWLDGREHAGMELTSGMQQLRSLVECFYDAMAAVECGDAQKALELSAKLRGAFPRSNMQLKMACSALSVWAKDSRPLADRDSESLMAQFKDLVAQGRQAYPQDGFYMKLEGDIAALEGDEALARKIWMQAVEYTCNGFVITDVANKTGYYPTWVRESNWAPLAGIPSWDGPLPEYTSAERPRTPVAPAEVVAFGPTSQEYLYGLLCQVADVCQAQGITYSVSRAAARAFSYGMLPDHLGDYEIFIAAADAPALAKALQEANLGPNRLVAWKDNDPTVKPGHVYLYGTDSTFVRMSDKTMVRKPNMFVYVRPVSSMTDKMSVSRRLLVKIQGALSRAFNKSVRFSTIDVTAPDGRTFTLLQSVPIHGEAPQEEFGWRGRDVFSTVIPGQRLLDEGLLPEGYFETEQKAEAARKIIDGKVERFFNNHKELQEAVDAKQRRWDKEHGK